MISFILHQLHNIISLQLLTVLPPFVHVQLPLIMSNNLELGKLHAVSSDPVKNPGERLTLICWAFSLSSGAWRGIGTVDVGGIDILQFTLGILFILKMIRQLVKIVGHSVDEPVTRTLICLIDT